MNNNLNKKINIRINQHISNLTCHSNVMTESNNDIKHKLIEKKQHKLNAIPNYVRTAYIKRVACPLHIIELTNNLNKIEISETLKIIVGGQAVISELLSACHSLGHKTLLIENNGRNELFVTRRQ